MTINNILREPLKTMSSGLAAPDPRTYRMRVKDLVLWAHIGIYPHELHAPQRVRFNVELAVAEHEGPLDDDIANVLSYADVVAGIRRILGRGHVNLVETLAEEVCAMCLADGRVLEARVAVEKMDVEPDAGSVGVEITRNRETVDAEALSAPVPAGMIDMARPWVIKLGGSMIRSPRLKEWIGMLADSGVPVTIVPGGGPFADDIRALQDLWRFDDRAAHAMAIAAMEQFGRMMLALDSRLRLCTDLSHFGPAMAGGRVAVWLPMAMTHGRADIEESWDVTSDSLAAWLAGKLAAQGLVLVKSAQPPSGKTTVAELTAQGLVDPAFGRFLAASGAQGWCVGADEPVSFGHALIQGGQPGTMIQSET